MTGNADHNATVKLDTLLATLDDLVGYSDGVARIELRELLASCKCFFSNFN